MQATPTRWSRVARLLNWGVFAKLVRRLQMLHRARGNPGGWGLHNTHSLNLNPRWLHVNVGEMVSETEEVQTLSDFLNFLGREGAGKKSRKSVFFQAFEAKKSVPDSIQKRSHS